MSLACNICANEGLERIHTLDSTAIDSLRSPSMRATSIWFCNRCGHVLTEPMDDIEAYYDERYNILTGDEDEDQLLKIVDGENIYRSDFQAGILLKTVELQPGMRILDYGCAKAATLKKIIRRVAVEPFVFDVSENYRSFWQGVFSADHQATYELPSAWNGSMDVVYSFFCLEHVLDITAALKAQHALLKQGGVCYFVVPDFHHNVADMLVMDHINHFTESSLHYALHEAGFTSIHLDNSTQAGWWIVRAARTKTAAGKLSPVPRDHLEAAEKTSKAIARYWEDVTARIMQLRLPPGAHAAIYGAGFYGTYAALHLAPQLTVDCFVDANRFLQGTTHLDRPVIAPSQLPAVVTHMLVALNPAHAREAMSSIPAWRHRNLIYEYMF